MTQHLCISVAFLDPLFHGKGDEEPEWPPSPMRLFQAMLAGARAACRSIGWSETKADAFRWLGQLTERQSPLIVAPTARRASGYILYVPNNDSDKKFDRRDRLTTKIARPHRLCDGDTVHYLWRLNEKDWALGRPHAELLCREARCLLALGWGVDQVVGNGRILTDAEADGLPGCRWRAWLTHRPGAQMWRMPASDSLEDLEQICQSFLERARGIQYLPERKPSRFSTVSYISTHALPARCYAGFELPEGVAFRQQQAATVAAMLRSITCQSAREDSHQFPGGSEVYVAGHTGKEKRTPPRFSYLPLPTLGHEHADGMIRRLVIAEPFGGDGAHALWAQNRLSNAVLRDQDGNDRGVLLDLWRTSSAAVVGRYVNEAREWATVTPVILPGFDDGRYAKAEKLFMAAMRDADLPIGAVEDLTIRRAPFWPGSQHPRQYAVPAYLKLLPAWHVRVVLSEPVTGPLAIGAGRHAGLGIFASTKT
jgi:CRISPR-associated protein Csb2